MLLVLSDKGKGMQSSSEQPLVGEDHCVTTLITAAKETSRVAALIRNNVVDSIRNITRRYLS